MHCFTRSDSISESESQPASHTKFRIPPDADVLSWFKSQGHGYQTRINKLLRAYMQAHQRRHS
ncbi:BrnA antitoxin family protein [Burkholderia guangdongensis]|uniref:BrnA antitoxin family protein n=1 Tax=Burkholderia guangdongensis TaxID=1792500 RepID=UPI0015CA7BB2|nr:BrnA antitoxin family protein [Burkholderia guangdongensis]